MPAPLTWDTPGLTWDSGLTWDGVAPSTRKTMNNTKASIDFSSYTAAELGPVAHTIHDKMAANAVTFATPPVPMATLQTQVTTYDAKLIARASNAKTDVIAFNEARDTLEESLGVLGNAQSRVLRLHHPGHTSRGPLLGLRLHRNLLQPQAPPQRPGLPIPYGLRTIHPKQLTQLPASTFSTKDHPDACTGAGSLHRTRLRGPGHSNPFHDDSSGTLGAYLTSTVSRIDSGGCLRTRRRFWTNVTIANATTPAAASPHGR